MYCNLYCPQKGDTKNANHSSLIRNNVVPCICLTVMTYAWSDVTRNAGIRKTNRATRYVGPRVPGCALCYRVVTYYLTLTTGNSLSVYATLTNRPSAIRHIHVKNPFDPLLNISNKIRQIWIGFRCAGNMMHFVREQL